MEMMKQRSVGLGLARLWSSAQRVEISAKPRTRSPLEQLALSSHPIWNTQPNIQYPPI